MVHVSYPMTADPLARVVQLPWSMEGAHGFYRIALGTKDALGMDLTGDVSAEASYDVPQKTITRYLWPAGPSVTYTRPAQRITRMVTGRASTAGGDSQVVLDAGDSRDTIPFTGPRRQFVKYLVSRSKNASIDIVIRGMNGNALAAISANPLGM